MARFPFSRKTDKPSRPPVTDDFIYDEPDAVPGGEPVPQASELPEDALKHFMDQRGADGDSAAEEYLRRRKGKAAFGFAGRSEAGRPGRKPAAAGTSEPGRADHGPSASSGAPESGRGNGVPAQASAPEEGESPSAPEESGARMRPGGESRLRSILSRREAEDCFDPGTAKEENTVPSLEETVSARQKARSAAAAVQLDENLQPIRRGRPEHRHPLLRRLLLIAITAVLVLTAGAFIFHRIIPTAPALGAPESAISRIVTPVQDFFSGLTEAVAGYFRQRKLRANIEAAYNELRAENERLVYKAMLAEELQNTLRQYEDLSDEIAANIQMQPIVSRVIGKSDSNYFSTFTINKGLRDGVEDYMAVTISGTLVGYTESVRETESTVRTIIDSKASIAGLIQSSRDQGTVRGTLGIDGTPMCRMYYLPDTNLPRPGDTVVTSGVGMSFPKGIPIGTVRESTRGMDSNKMYIVLEPEADFQHLEYVIVLRYKPVPEAIRGRENGRTSVELVPLESARPSPEVPQIASSLFESQNTPTPDPDATATPTAVPTDTPEPTEEPTPEPTPTPEHEVLEYQPVRRQTENTPTATPSPVPTPTPYLTPDPQDMTFEEDEE